MANNYPPGVTGNEPHLTGEIEYDPHAPFFVGDDPETDGQFAVHFGPNWEEHFFDGFHTEKTAQFLADLLNRRWSLREPYPDDNGICRVCGDLHGEPPGESEPA